MAGKSRWADDDADAQARKREKEEKRRAKAERERRAAEEAAAQQRQREQEALQADDRPTDHRPTKRRRLSEEPAPEEPAPEAPLALLRLTAPSWSPSRRVSIFEQLNHIDEGTYGTVSRVKDLSTGSIVALKKLKMGRIGDGFPDMALREIQTLQECRHAHIVDLKEVVVGTTLLDVYLVMEFLEHDLRALQEDMVEPFLPSEIKTLMLQITSAVEYLHDHWILHRDLKPSNILLNNRGQTKLADFGMARHFSSPPLANMSQLVVTLWYRAPELLLGTSVYDSAIDMWSLGCIFGELFGKEPLLQGKNEVDQVGKIFALRGTPTEATWPSVRRLPNARALRLPSTAPPPPSLRPAFPLLTTAGVDLLSSLLELNPAGRPSATQVLTHPYFTEDPRPKSTAMFPTFPSKAGLERRRKKLSPNAPMRGEAPRFGAGDFGAALGPIGEGGGVWGV
ncbi:Pkinase-domain-containing protein [Trichodelitschia bisporula]|uniref:cyclin-dependent kinase n=1 Tax=Trichodelitschia bisporula TaxID=703511 RepID=A0A6G1HRK1_9PEZI|nr:Pkinase-domain-containing protein [Trichodelitschia bisporula]